MALLQISNNVVFINGEDCYSDSYENYVKDGGLLENIYSVYDDAQPYYMLSDRSMTEIERQTYLAEILRVSVLIRAKQQREYIVPTLEEAKANKSKENDSKAELAREGQAFTIEVSGVLLSFLTNRKTQQDLQTALSFLQAGMQSYQWIDEQGVLFNFETSVQVIQVATEFMNKANVYPKWLVFKKQIDEARTVEEVMNIVIDYGINV